MNKNIIIGVLGAVIVLAGGYYLLKNKAPGPVAVQQPPMTSTPPPGTTEPTPVSKPPAVVAPEVVTDQGSSASSSTVVLNGKVKPNGASTTYWFEYGETTAFGTRSTVQAVGSGYSFIGTPAYITGLKANTPYYFRLSAKNKIATVNGETFIFRTNSNPPIQGVVPTAKTGSATEISRTGAKLNSQVDANGSSSSYWFEYGTDANFGAITTILPAGDSEAAISLSASLVGLDPETRYYYRLNAQNQYGTVNGSTLSFKTLGPPAAAAPTVSTSSASNIASTKATLNGRVDPNGATTTYWFEYGTDSLLSVLIGRGTPE